MVFVQIRGENNICEKHKHQFRKKRKLMWTVDCIILYHMQIKPVIEFNCVFDCVTVCFVTDLPGDFFIYLTRLYFLNKIIEIVARVL